MERIYHAKPETKQGTALRGDNLRFGEN